MGIINTKNTHRNSTTCHTVQQTDPEPIGCSMQTPPRVSTKSYGYTHSHNTISKWNSNNCENRRIQRQYNNKFCFND